MWFHQWILLLLFMILCDRHCTPMHATYTTTKFNESKSMIDVLLKQEPKQRHMQVENDRTYNYRATYRATFQLLVDTECGTNGSPVLQISCSSPHMTILQTSDDSIACNQIPSYHPFVANGTTYECVTTCIGTECEKIYLANSSNHVLGSNDGPVGSITFMCEGDDDQQVDAVLYDSSYIYEEESCTIYNASTNTTTATRRILLFTQLGILCPTGSTQEFQYDAAYFECTFGSYQMDQNRDGNTYICASGFHCQGNACSESFGLTIQSVVPAFLFTCVETILETITSFPTTSPENKNTSQLTSYIASFEASWGLLYNTTKSQELCVSGNPTITISCDNNASILYRNSSESTTECTNTGNNILLCNTSPENIVNQFTSVFYDCMGPNIPTSSVIYNGFAAYCDGNLDSASISHAVTLGVYCNAPYETDYYYYGDFVVECTKDSNDFDTPIGMFGLYGDRYVCLETAIFPPNSQSNNTKIIPSVGIKTDTSWFQNIEEYGCYTITSISEAPTPAHASQWNSSPNVSPLSDTNPQSSKGYIIGSVVGVITAVLIIGFVIRNRYRKRTVQKSEISQLSLDYLNMPIQITSRDSLCVLPPPPPPPPQTVVESDIPNEGIIQNFVPLNDSIVQSQQNVIVSQITTTTTVPDLLLPVQYKDQARSVMPSATGILVDQHVNDIPLVAVALDVSTTTAAAEIDTVAEK